MKKDSKTGTRRSVSYGELPLSDGSPKSEPKSINSAKSITPSASPVILAAEREELEKLRNQEVSISAVFPVDMLPPLRAYFKFKQKEVSSRFHEEDAALRQVKEEIRGKYREDYLLIEHFFGALLDDSKVEEGIAGALLVIRTGQHEKLIALKASSDKIEQDSAALKKLSDQDPQRLTGEQNLEEASKRYEAAVIELFADCARKFLSPSQPAAPSPASVALRRRREEAARKAKEDSREGFLPE